MKKKREMEMKKQFLKSAAILSLAVTAVSTSQPVGAIVRNKKISTINIEDVKENLIYNDYFLKVADQRLLDKFEEAKRLASDLEFQEEYKESLSKFIDKISLYEAFMTSKKLLSLKDPANKKYIEYDTNLLKNGHKREKSYRYSGVDKISENTLNKLCVGLDNSIDSFLKEVREVQAKSTRLGRMSNQLFEQKYDAIRQLWIEIDALVKTYRGFEATKYEADLLKEKLHLILNTQNNDQKSWSEYLYNEKIADRIIGDLEFSINEFYDNLGKIRTKKIPKFEYDKYKDYSKQEKIDYIYKYRQTVSDLIDKETSKWKKSNGTDKVKNQVDDLLLSEEESEKLSYDKVKHWENIDKIAKKIRKYQGFNLVKNVESTEGDLIDNWEDLLKQGLEINTELKQLYNNIELLPKDLQENLSNIDKRAININKYSQSLLKQISKLSKQEITKIESLYTIDRSLMDFGETSIEERFNKLNLSPNITGIESIAKMLRTELRYINQGLHQYRVLLLEKGIAINSDQSKTKLHKQNSQNELKFANSTISSSMKPLPYVITYQVNQSDNKVLQPILQPQRTVSVSYEEYIYSPKTLKLQNDAQKQKVEQEKTKSLAPQKEAVKEQTEQKISGKTQGVEKKSETVATPQQSSVAQTSVQQPAPVQSVVQESKASQEEINAAHDAISAYKSIVNIANTAGVTTAEMTTLINTQTSNLSDVEKALGNNKVNNGAVNVLREDTARLENMIWNRAYQAIEEFNVARNTYNNQIKTETVPVDNDIEAILAGSQAKISHLDNRIGARHMDQAFVASLLEVTEMSKSISSRIKE